MGVFATIGCYFEVRELPREMCMPPLRTAFESSLMNLQRPGRSQKKKFPFNSSRPLGSDTYFYQVKVESKESVLCWEEFLLLC